MPLKTLIIRDFSKGLNEKIDPQDTSGQFAAVLENMHVLKTNGALVGRPRYYEVDEDRVDGKEVKNLFTYIYSVDTPSPPDNNQPIFIAVKMVNGSQQLRVKPYYDGFKWVNNWSTVHTLGAAPYNLMQSIIRNGDARLYLSSGNGDYKSIWYGYIDSKWLDDYILLNTDGTYELNPGTTYETQEYVATPITMADSPAGSVFVYSYGNGKASYGGLSKLNDATSYSASFETLDSQIGLPIIPTGDGADGNALKIQINLPVDTLDKRVSAIYLWRATGASFSTAGIKRRLHVLRLDEPIKQTGLSSVHGSYNGEYWERGKAPEGGPGSGYIGGNHIHHGKWPDGATATLGDFLGRRNTVGDVDNYDFKDASSFDNSSASRLHTKQVDYTDDGLNFKVGGGGTDFSHVAETNGPLTGGAADFPVYDRADEDSLPLNDPKRKHGRLWIYAQDKSFRVTHDADRRSRNASDFGVSLVRCGAIPTTDPESSTPKTTYYAMGGLPRDESGNVDHPSHYWVGHIEPIRIAVVTDLQESSADPPTFDDYIKFKDPGPSVDPYESYIHPLIQEGRTLVYPIRFNGDASKDAVHHLEKACRVKSVTHEAGTGEGETRITFADRSRSLLKWWEYEAGSDIDAIGICCVGRSDGNDRSAGFQPEAVDGLLQPDIVGGEIVTHAMGKDLSYVKGRTFGNGQGKALQEDLNRGITYSGPTLPPDQSRTKIGFDGFGDLDAPLQHSVNFYTAEASNTRVEGGAGDLQWDIPGYICHFFWATQSKSWPAHDEPLNYSLTQPWIVQESNGKAIGVIMDFGKDLSTSPSIDSDIGMSGAVEGDGDAEGRYAAHVGDRTFLGDFKFPEDIRQKDAAVYSVWQGSAPNQDLFDALNTIEFGGGDSGKIKQMVEYDNKLFVFKDYEVFVAAVDPVNQARVAADRFPNGGGLLAERSVVKANGALFYLAPDGFRAIAGGQGEIISRPIETLLSRLTDKDKAAATGAYDHKNRAVVWMVKDNSEPTEYDHRIFVLEESQSWTTYTISLGDSLEAGALVQHPTGSPLIAANEFTPNSGSGSHIIPGASELLTGTSNPVDRSVYFQLEGSSADPLADGKYRYKTGHLLEQLENDSVVRAVYIRVLCDGANGTLNLYSDGRLSGRFIVGDSDQILDLSFPVMSEREDVGGYTGVPQGGFHELEFECSSDTLNRLEIYHLGIGYTESRRKRVRNLPPMAVAAAMPDTTGDSASYAVSSKYAIKFDGVDDHLRADKSTATGLSVTFSSTFTLSAWVRAPRYTSGSLIARGMDSSLNTQYRLSMATNSDDYSYVRFQLGDAYVTDSEVGVAIFKDGLPHFIVVTHAADGNTLIYIDGVLQGTYTGGDTQAVDMNPTFGVAYNQTTTQFIDQYNGWLGEMAAWGSILGASEVTALYNSGVPISLSANSGAYTSSSNLVAWWKFGDGTESGIGSTVYNMAATGSAYHLSRLNMLNEAYEKVGPWSPVPGETLASTKCYKISSGKAEITDADSPVNKLTPVDDYSVTLWLKTDSTMGTASGSEVYPIRIPAASGSDDLFNIRLHDAYHGTSDAGHLTVSGCFGQFDNPRASAETDYRWTHDVWHSITLSYAGATDKTARLYIDGVFVGKSLPNTNWSSSGYGKLKLGDSTGLIAWYDWLSVHSCVLGAEEIWAMYNGGSRWVLTSDSGDYVSSSKLIAWYKFEEFTGTSVVDSSTNSYSLTLDATGNVWDTLAGLDFVAPDAPTGLTATAGNAQAVLDWNDNSDADLAGYKVYRSTTSGSGYSLVTTLGTTSTYTDTGLTNDTAYYWVVTAIDGTPNESGNSNEATATPVNPVTCVTTSFSHSLDADGSDEYFAFTRADVPDLLMEFDRNWSFGFWCRCDSYDGGVVWTNGYGTSSYTNRIYVSKNVNPYVVVQFGTTSIYDTTACKIRSRRKEFFHVLVTHVADGETKIYINGVEADQSSSGSVVSSTMNPTLLARWNSSSSDGSSPTYTWKGEMGDIAVWSSVLTSTQVTDAYDGGAPPDLNSHDASSSLVAWYQFGDGTEDTTSTPSTLYNMSTNNTDSNYDATGYNWDSAADFKSEGPFGPDPNFDDASTKKLAIAVGTGNYGTLPSDHPALTYDWTRSFSVLCWFEIAENPAGSYTQRLIGRSADSDGGSSYTEHYSHGFQVIRQSTQDPRLNIYARVGSRNASGGNSSMKRFDVGAKICVLMTFDYDSGGGDHVLKLYLNGYLQDTDTAASFNPGTVPAADIAENDYYVGGVANFSEEIYQLAYFDVALNSVDAFNLWNKGVPMDPTVDGCSWTKASNCSAYHPFNETTGSSASDSVGSKNITLTGSYTWEDDS